MSTTPTVDKPLGVITADNQSGLISIMTALSLCFVLVSFAIRIYVRYPKGLWKLDDNVWTAATILSCVQSALVFYEVSIGLGQRSVLNEKSGDFKSLEKFHFANNYMYIITLLLSKASIGFLYLRLTKAKGHIYATWAIQGVCAVWAILGILIISIGVSWRDAFDIPFWRWLVVGITDCLTDILQVGMSVYLVKDLRMTKVQKGTVVFAFALRLLTVPAIVMRLYYLNPSVIPSNRPFAISLSVVCTQLELGYGIMAASIAVLRPFMAVYEKGPNGTYYGNAAQKYYTAESGKGSFKLTSVNSNSQTSNQKTKNLTNHTVNSMKSNPRSPTQSYAASVSHWEAGNVLSGISGHKKKLSQREKAESIHSQDSRKMIIERKTDWSIRYEEEDGTSKEGGSSF